MSKEEQAKQAAEVAEVKESQIVVQDEAPMGFEDDDPSDLIIPRIKVINALSPERKDKIADEGDIINSLTKEKLNGKIFIPIYKFTNVILWKDRADGGGIAAISRDGKIMIPTNGEPPYPVGKLADFDNTKTGKDAQPTHVKYINFFGFFAGERMPIILSFAKTNYAEGKRMYSLAKVTLENMWNNGYKLESKLMKKAANEWFNIVVVPDGNTSPEDRAFGMAMYKQFRNMELNFDVEDTSGASEPQPGTATDSELKDSEF
ncbi:hypothetical protein D3C75_158720 [compost metagenome]